MGHVRAARLLLLCDAFSADEARDAGLINEVVGTGNALARARELAETLEPDDVPVHAVALDLGAVGVGKDPGGAEKNSGCAEQGAQASAAEEEPEVCDNGAALFVLHQEGDRRSRQD